jgi:hypothetical protein
MATFIRLIDYKSEEDKEKEFFNPKNKFVVAKQVNFSKIPENPIAYKIASNEKILVKYQNGNIRKIYSKIGCQPGSELIFFWWEVIQSNNRKRYFSYNKGGEYRKWYGNQFWILDYGEDGKNVIDKGGQISNQRYYGKAHISWTRVSNKLNLRYYPNGFIFDNTAPSIFENITYFLAYLNSKVGEHNRLLKYSGTKIESGHINGISPIDTSEQTKSHIDNLTKQCIDISREEWDSRETSWDFTTNELLRHKTSNHLEDAFYNYCSYWKEKFHKLHTNEEELNRIFIDIYDLADELTPDVPLEDITILKDESEIKDGEPIFKKDVIIEQFISYAVGCMFGRYSPDKEGLILANQGETIDDFREKVMNPSFMPDDDNIIPILEDEYFTDDIVSRFKQFLKATFGAESLAENLDFIAGALSNSKNGTKSPEKTIRDYFLKSFFKDHTRTYKKRPIYWLFTSGKGRGFNALVYMHRYDKTTLAKMRTDYLLELESKLDARIDMLSPDSAKDKQERERLSAQIEELAAYDEVLNNKALRFIDIDLDDGVVVNYAKFEGLVEKV